MPLTAFILETSLFNHIYSNEIDLMKKCSALLGISYTTFNIILYTIIEPLAIVILICLLFIPRHQKLKFYTLSILLSLTAIYLGVCCCVSYL